MGHAGIQDHQKDESHAAEEAMLRQKNELVHLPT